MSTVKPSVEAQLIRVVLTFEVAIVMLSGLTLYGLDATLAWGMPSWVALAFGAGVTVLGLLAVGVVNRSIRAARVLGSLVQLALAVAGFALPALWFVVALFGALWAYALRMGSRIDAKAAAEASTH